MVKQNKLGSLTVTLIDGYAAAGSVSSDWIPMAQNSGGYTSIGIHAYSTHASNDGYVYIDFSLVEDLTTSKNTVIQSSGGPVPTNSITNYVTMSYAKLASYSVGVAPTTGVGSAGFKLSAVSNHIFTIYPINARYVRVRYVGSSGSGTVSVLACRQK